LLKEAAQLIELDSKIDHPPGGGTKDTTDSAAAAYLSAISSQEVTSLTIPQTPSALVGIMGSVVPNASPEDPFGFYTQINRSIQRHFRV
jgi:hypothetical protein